LKPLRLRAHLRPSGTAPARRAHRQPRRKWQTEVHRIAAYGLRHGSRWGNASRTLSICDADDRRLSPDRVSGKDLPVSSAADQLPTDVLRGTMDQAARRPIRPRGAL